MVNKYDDNDDDDDDDNAYLIRWVVVQLFFRTKCHRTVMFLTINNDSLTENKQEIQLSLTGRAQHHYKTQERNSGLIEEPRSDWSRTNWHVKFGIYREAALEIDVYEWNALFRPLRNLQYKKNIKLQSKKLQSKVMSHCIK